MIESTMTPGEQVLIEQLIARHGLYGLLDAIAITVWNRAGDCHRSVGRADMNLVVPMRKRAEAWENCAREVEGAAAATLFLLEGVKR